MTYRHLGDQEFKSLIGQGVHTALRKGVDSPESVRAWLAIDDLPKEAWDTVLQYVYDGLESIGVFLVRQEVTPKARERETEEPAA